MANVFYSLKLTKMDDEQSYTFGVHLGVRLIPFLDYAYPSHIAL